MVAAIHNGVSDEVLCLFCGCQSQGKLVIMRLEGGKCKELADILRNVDPTSEYPRRRERVI